MGKVPHLGPPFTCARVPPPPICRQRAPSACTLHARLPPLPLLFPLPFALGQAHTRTRTHTPPAPHPHPRLHPHALGNSGPIRPGHYHLHSCQSQNPPRRTTRPETVIRKNPPSTTPILTLTHSTFRQTNCTDCTRLTWPEKRPTVGPQCRSTETCPLRKIQISTRPISLATSPHHPPLP